MENNRFYQHRMEIKEISEKNNADVSVAARMLAKEKGWENYHAELSAWDEHCRYYVKHPTKTLADLFAD